MDCLGRKSEGKSVVFQAKSRTLNRTFANAEPLEKGVLPIVFSYGNSEPEVEFLP